MKKFLLILFILCYVSSVPSFARKLIVNPDEDRIVKSRTMGKMYTVTIPDVPEVLLEKKYNQNNNINHKYTNNGIHKSSGYQGERYEKYFKPLLEADFRPELMGTTWDYPDYSYENTDIKEQNNLQEFQQSDMKTVTRHYAREAADYSYRDTLTNQLVKTGFDINVKE